MGLLEAGLWYLLDRALGPLEPKPETPTLELDTVKDSFQTSGMLRLVEPVTSEREKPPMSRSVGFNPGKPAGFYDFGRADCDTHGKGCKGFREARSNDGYDCYACALALNARTFASGVEQQKRAREAMWGRGSD